MRRSAVIERITFAGAVEIIMFPSVFHSFLIQFHTRYYTVTSVHVGSLEFLLNRHFYASSLPSVRSESPHAMTNHEGKQRY